MVDAFKGPIVAFGTRAPPGNLNENPNLAPSLIWGGAMGIDPRAGYNVTKYGAIGMPMDSAAVVNQVPSAISAVNIAAVQTPGSTLPLNLVAATGAGITVLASPLTVWGSGNVIPAGTLAIDGPPGLVAFGTPQLSSGYTQVSVYDPTKAIARNVRITSGGNDSGITFLVSGYDLYGYPQTEQITGANAGVASGKKAFKFIASVVASAAPASTVSVGTGDVYGFPLLSSFWGDATVVWNNTFVSANTGYTASDTTSPATSTTGDVRGTYAVQSQASNGTARLMMYVNPSVNNIALGTVGMFGQTPA
jgi:hypothetical protein